MSGPIALTMRGWKKKKGKRREKKEKEKGEKKWTPGAVVLSQTFEPLMRQLWRGKKGKKGEQGRTRGEGPITLSPRPISAGPA